MALIRVFAFFLPQEQGGNKAFFHQWGCFGIFGGVEGIGITRSMLVAHTDIQCHKGVPSQQWNMGTDEGDIRLHEIVLFIT